MDSLTCTVNQNRDSSKYLYLPHGWTIKHKNRSHGDTPVWGLNIFHYSSGNELLVWRTSRSKFSLNLYILSARGNYSRYYDCIWMDSNHNKITATPTTLEVIKLYQTFL